MIRETGKALVMTHDYNRARPGTTRTMGPSTGRRGILKPELKTLKKTRTSNRSVMTQPGGGTGGHMASRSHGYDYGMMDGGGYG